MKWGKRGREVGVRGEGSGECLSPVNPLNYSWLSFFFLFFLFVCFSFCFFRGVICLHDINLTIMKKINFEMKAAVLDSLESFRCFSFVLQICLKKDVLYHIVLLYKNFVNSLVSTAGTVGIMFPWRC